MSFSEESLEDKIAKAMAAISTPVTPLNSGSRKAPTLLTSSKSVGAVNLPSEDVDITDSFSSKKNVSFNDLPKAEHHSDESVRASQSDGNLATSSAESDSGFAMPSLEPVQKPKAITSRTIRRSKSENSTGADSPNPDNSESSTNVTPSNPEVGISIHLLIHCTPR